MLANIGKIAGYEAELDNCRKKVYKMLMFILGCMAGGIIGVVTMCIFTVSGQQSRLKEERRDDVVKMD